MMLEKSDATVRSCACQIVLKSINVMITHNNFDLKKSKFEGLSPEEIAKDDKLKQEKMIIDFLEMLLLLLHTTVAKNWKNM